MPFLHGYCCEGFKYSVMRKTKYIDIRLVRMDRYPMNLSTLELIDYMRDGGVIPPIKVSTHIKGGYIIKDGRHRMLACKMLGRQKIEATFSTIPIKNITT